MHTRMTQGAFSTSELPFIQHPQSEHSLNLIHFVSFDELAAVGFTLFRKDLERRHAIISFPMYLL